MQLETISRTSSTAQVAGAPVQQNTKHFETFAFYAILVSSG